MRMQDGNIAIPDDPLWLLFEFFKIDPVNDPAHTITPASAKHCLYFVVIQHLLEISQPLFIRPGKIICRITPYCLPHFYFISPFFLQNTYAFRSLFGIHITGRAYKSDGISFFEVRWRHNHELIYGL